MSGVEIRAFQDVRGIAELFFGTMHEVTVSARRIEIKKVSLHRALTDSCGIFSAFTAA